MANRFPEFHKILLDLCRVSLAIPDDGAAPSPCAHLIEEVSAHGRERIAKRVTQTPGPNEYRLNGDDLKLCYEVEYFRDGDFTNVYVTNLRIEGDQVERYPAFTRAAQPILEAAKVMSAPRVLRRAIE